MKTTSNPMGTALALALGVAVAWSQPVDVEGELEAAKAFYRQAKFGEAIARLQAVIVQLEQLRDTPAQRKGLADAHLHVALSYTGLNEPAAAKDSLKAMVRVDPDRTLDPEVYAPKVVLLFEEARVEVAREQAAEAAAAAAAAAEAERQGGSKKLPILLGVGGAAAAGIAMAAGGGGGTGAGVGPVAPTPAVTATVSPDGIAIIHVTELTFTASVANLSSPTFAWTFGEGSTASGQSVTHVYGAEGAFAVTVTATGTEGTAMDAVAATARDVSGVWEQDTSNDVRIRLEITQQGAALTGWWNWFMVFEGNWFLDERSPLSGVVTDPRGFHVLSHDWCAHEFFGTFNSDVTQMGGQGQNPGHCGSSNTWSMVLVRR